MKTAAGNAVERTSTERGCGFDDFEIGQLVRLKGQIVGLSGEVVCIDPSRGIQSLWSERGALDRFAPDAKLQVRFRGRSQFSFLVWLPASALVPAPPVEVGGRSETELSSEERS